MKRFAVLARVGLQSMLLGVGGAGLRGKKRRMRSALGAAALIAGLGLYVSGIYSYALLEVLAPIHMEGLLFMLMGVAALVSGVLFTVFAVKNTVFGGQDNDLLLSMPVSTTTLMLSRVAAIYAESLLFTFFMLVPAGVVCAVLPASGVGCDFGFWARLLISAISLPMLDTALSLLLGAGIAWLSSKVSRKAIGQNLVMGLYLLAAFWFGFNVNSMIKDLAASAGRVRDALGWLRPVAWMAEGIVGSWPQTLAFAAVCAAPLALAVLLLGRVFRRAVTAFAAQSARSDYRLTGQRALGQRRALLAKELRRILGSPTWFWNAATGLFMLAAGSVYLLVRREGAQAVAAMLGDGAVLRLAPLAVMGFCLSMGIVAAPSVSLEGKSLWVLQEAPVRGRTVIGVKTGAQLLLTAPFIALSLACLALSGLLGPRDWLLVASFALLFEIGHACFGMLMGLVFARLDAPSEAAVIKRSLLSFLSIFGPMALLGLGALAGWLLSRAGAWTPLWGIAAGLWGAAALLAAASALTLARRGERLLKGLSE